MNDKIVITEQATPAQLIELAINKDLDIEKLSKLLEMKKEWDAKIAREQFFEALTDFQAACPELRKSKKVSFRSEKTGQLTEYHYATLADITRQLKVPLKDVSLAYRWEIQDSVEEIKVTCLVTHKAGHTEQTQMMAKPDTSGSKNPIQARGSTIEYLKRYTLIGALGISTSDSDVDGSMPEMDVDKLHKDYMVYYNQLIRIDGSFTKWHPDNWVSERTGKTYVKAIAEIRKKLFELTGKEV
jgi:hypothetical protein